MRLNKNYGLTDIICLIIIFVYAFSFNYASLQQITLWILLPCGFVLTWIERRSFAFNPYLKYLFILFGWCSFTYFFAEHKSEAFAEITKIWGVYIFCYILANLASKKDLVTSVFVAYIVLYILYIEYARTHIIEMAASNVIGNSQRLGDQKLNSNIFGYFTFFITISIYYLGDRLSSTYVKRLLRIAFLLLIPLSFYISLLTASRQILIVEIPLFVILLSKRYITQTVGGYFKFILLCLISYLALLQFYETSYKNSLLSERSETNVADDSRMVLVREAIELGIKNPVFGVGPGNFKFHANERVFSHNSYLELFSNSGIIAIILYSILILKLITEQYYAYKKTKSKYHFIFLIFAIFYAFDNIFYVFYLNPWLMGFFIFIASLSLEYNDKNILLNSKKIIENNFYKIIRNNIITN